jgi:hypothetical protein
MFSTLVYCFVCLLIVSAKATTLLDIVRSDPQLSTFASFITGTGGGLLNPGT